MAPVNPLHARVARFPPLLENRSTPPVEVKSEKSSTVSSQQGTRAPVQEVSDARFTRDTFTPDAGPSANASRWLGGNMVAQVTSAVGAAAATTASEGNRPVASYPEPSQLPGVAESDYAHGQAGPSPNETGMIGGAAELAQYTYAGYNGGEFGPVSIAPAKLYEGDTATDVHLVSISGTEPVTGQSTGWITNFKSGSELNSPGLRNAKEAILRTVPEGSTLVLSGHSQGGMIAQQLAADPDLKEKYDIKSTVTFGSPLIAAGTREGEVHRIAAALDPVPRLSVESVLGFPWGLLGQQNIGTDTPNPIASHSQNYTNESNTQLARMDALGRVNPRTRATLEVDVSQRVFFTSPTNTIAGTPEAGELPPPPVAPPLPGNYPPPYPYYPGVGGDEWVSFPSNPFPGDYLLSSPDQPGVLEEWVSFPLNPFPSSPGDYAFPRPWDVSSEFDDLYSLD